MTIEPDGFGEIGEATLSPAGRARKAAMLAELDTAMRRRNGRRVAVRAGAVALPVILVCAAVYWFGFPARPAAVNGGGAVVAEVVPPKFDRQPSFEIIRTGTSSPKLVQRIDDAELQSMLAAAGKPSGLVRTGGRVLLASDLEPTGQETPADEGAEPAGVSG